MGGIKNKLSKKLSKFLPLDRRNAGGISSRSTSGQPEVRRLEGGRRNLSEEGNNNKGSRLPSFSQPSEMPDGQISNTSKLSHLGLYAEKTIGSLCPKKQGCNPTSPARGGSSASGTTSRSTSD